MRHRIADHADDVNRATARAHQDALADRVSPRHARLARVSLTMATAGAGAIGLIEVAARDEFQAHRSEEPGVTMFWLPSIARSLPTSPGSQKRPPSRSIVNGTTRAAAASRPGRR